MKVSTFHLLLLIALFFPLTKVSGKEPPHVKLLGIWAYGENVTDSLKLNHKQNNLRFFCGTEENIPFDSLSYRFKLNGFDKDWTTPFREGWNFYTDLTPGEYEFVAQSRYIGEQWGPPISYRFTILTPWWRTWWAYGLYIIAASFTAIYIIYISRLKIRLHNQLTIERENQRFRTELIMHAGREFRTPLTIIRSTIEKLKGTSDEHLTRTDLQHLRNSSRMLMQMVEQLVEFREIGRGLPYCNKDDIIEMADIPINKDTTIIVATSNSHLADVIRRDLMQFMRAIVVTDGKSVLTSVEIYHPDAIILDTDISTETYNLLHELKRRADSSTIPVILISDFDNKRSLLRAIRSEADDYLQKPFNCEVLTALVMKKIKLRREAASGAKETQKTRPPPFFEKRTDKLFLENLDKTIEANIANPDFDINSLADMLSISRGQLYNKIKSLRGLTPIEYLRDMRLTKAAALLRENRISVKETRSSIGMPDATNFNRRFKEKYGVCPTEYR